MINKFRVAVYFLLAAIGIANAVIIATKAIDNEWNLLVFMSITFLVIGLISLYIGLKLVRAKILQNYSLKLIVGGLFLLLSITFTLSAYDRIFFLGTLPFSLFFFLIGGIYLYYGWKEFKMHED